MRFYIVATNLSYFLHWNNEVQHSLLCSLILMALWILCFLSTMFKDMRTHKNEWRRYFIYTIVYRIDPNSTMYNMGRDTMGNTFIKLGSWKNPPSFSDLITLRRTCYLKLFRLRVGTFLYLSSYIHQNGKLLLRYCVALFEHSGIDSRPPSEKALAFCDLCWM